MFMVVTILNYVSRGGTLRERPCCPAAPAAAAAGAGAVRHAAGTEVGVQRPEKRTGSEVRAAHRSYRGIDRSRRRERGGAKKDD